MAGRHEHAEPGAERRAAAAALRRRRSGCSRATCAADGPGCCLPLVAGATVVTQLIAAPAAVVAVLVGAARRRPSARRRPGARATGRAADRSAGSARSRCPCCRGSRSTCTSTAGSGRSRDAAGRRRAATVGAQLAGSSSCCTRPASTCSGPLAAALAVARRRHTGRLRGRRSVIAIAGAVALIVALSLRRAPARASAPRLLGSASCSCRSRACTSCSPRTRLGRRRARLRRPLLRRVRRCLRGVRRHGRHARSATGDRGSRAACACGLALAARVADARPRLSLAGRMSTAAIRDPFAVADVEAELAARPSRRGAPGAVRSRRTWPRPARARDRARPLGRRATGASTRRTTAPTTRRTRSRTPSRSPSTARRPCSARTSSRSIRRGALPPRTTVAVRRLEPPGVELADVRQRTSLPAALALERPYAVLPRRARLVDRAVVATACSRCASCASRCMCVSVGFLWAAVREAWPANPLAAGVAAIVLATMSGLVERVRRVPARGAACSRSGVRACGSCCAICGARRCSAWTVAVVDGGDLREQRRGAGGRRGDRRTLALRADGLREPRRVARASRGRARRRRSCGSLWNLHAYGDPWPLNVVAGGPPTGRATGTCSRRCSRRSSSSTRRIFDGLYNVGRAAADAPRRAARGVRRRGGRARARVGALIGTHRVRAPRARAASAC